MIFTKKIINCITSNAKVLILLDEIDSFQFLWNFLRDFRISSKAWNLESYSYIIVIMSCSEDIISVLTAQYICLLNIILFIDIRRNTLNKITAIEISRKYLILFYMYSIDYSSYISQVTIFSPSHPEESTALKQNDCCPTWFWLGYHVTFL